MSAVKETFGNPFSSQFMRMRQAGPFHLVIFGASGDLTQRKLIPALFNLFLDGYAADQFSIVGFARREKSDEQFRAEMGASVRQYSRRQPESEEQLQQFLAHLHYVSGSFENEAGYYHLKDRLKALCLSYQMPSNALFYLATPPDAFPDIIRNLHRGGLVSPVFDVDGWTRIVVEKPFGRDTATAWELNGTIHAAFRERQVYRIDHYLGKETVQNILVFRLGNSIFEPLWNRRYIDHVQITVAESLGVGSRAGYFEQAGIIRDMIQSHILQVFTLIAMEPPATFDATAIRDEKVKVLKSLHLPSPEQVPFQVVRGQYSPGSLGGEPVPGYLQEAGIAPNSSTETYVALKLTIDNWRWSGVPFYIRTGKRLPKRVTDVAIVFKEPPHMIFDEAGRGSRHTNLLRLRLQPQEGISLSFGAKAPGPTVKVAPVHMDFMYASSFGASSTEAYERLILDALTGDSTLFAREDEVELSWSLVDRIVANWQSTKLHSYSAGGWGPEAADDLLKRDARDWLRL
ncbi:MAG: glucose-6-phosphate dehydrogenase [Candidatus Zixiibacteriota bacterium]